MDGLDIYGRDYLRLRFRPALVQRVAKLELLASKLTVQERSEEHYVAQEARQVGRLMLHVELLLTATSEHADDYVPWSSHLTDTDFARLIWNFLVAKSTAEKISILLQCVPGDGRQEADKLPLAVLRSLSVLARFLDPAHWGLVNWRVLACLGFPSMTSLKNCRLEATAAAMQAQFARISRREWQAAQLVMRRARSLGLPTTASVAAALYCISLELWPLEGPFDRVASKSGQRRLPTSVPAAAGAADGNL